MQTINTLLVDDNATFLEAAARFLEGHLKIVGRARSGTEALEAVATLRPQLVVMDVSMPGMDGFEATRLLKRQGVAPLIVLVSIHDSDEAQAAAQAVQADGFVPKDRFCSHLMPLLKTLLETPQESNRVG